MAAERKYTDRDVRENPSLRDLAEEYVQNYGGDFEPLVDASKDLESGRTLSTQQVRVVLNCMRYDRNVAADMPEPQRPKLELVMDETLPKRTLPKKIPWDYPCENTESHDGHPWHEDGPKKSQHWCEGVAYPIMRENQFTLDAVLNRPFFVAGQGKLLHVLQPEAWMLWETPGRHIFGQAMPFALVVRSVCNYARNTRNPSLLTTAEAMELVNVQSILGHKLCVHCSKEIEEESWRQSQNS